MFMKLSRKQQGIGLLELMLSLAIIAILIIMATRYYQSTSRSEKVNEMSEFISDTIAAAQQYAAGRAAHMGGLGVTQLINTGAIPKTYVGSDGKSINSPAGGTFDVTSPATDNVEADFTIKGLPDYICSALGDKFAGTGADDINGKCDTTTFTYATRTDGGAYTTTQ